MSDGRLMERLLAALIEPELRDDFFAELENETDRLRGELSPAEAERWRRRQLVVSVGPMLLRRAARGEALGHTRRPRMETLVHDLRFACRALRRRPIFSIVAILTLALGIGANTAIFSVVDGVFLSGVPGLEDTRGLVEISRDAGGAFFDLSYPTILNAREHSKTLDDVAATTPVAVALDREEEASAHMSLAVTGNYFELLGLSPAHGRFFAPEESFHPTAGDVVVISHGLWERRFDLDPEVVGSTIRINQRPMKVVGVAPRAFAGHWIGLQIGLWIPIGSPVPGLPGQGIDEPTSAMFEAIGRLAPGATREQAAEELSILSGTLLQRASPGFDPDRYRARVEPWAPVPALIRTGVVTFLAVLSVLAALVLAMAATNVASMILARLNERRDELAARLSLGASRWRIVRQLLTESVLLFVVGGAFGIVGAVVGTRLLLAFEPPLPPGFLLDFELGLDGGLLAFALVLSALSGLAFSLLPALGASREALAGSLRDSGSSLLLARRQVRLRGVMVAVQMAATVVLLVAAGLFARALSSLESLDPGFRADGVLTVDVDLELTGYDEARGAAFYSSLIDSVRELPGVDFASLAVKLPLAGRSSFGDVSVPGLEPPPGRQGFDASLNRVSSGYFATLGIPLLEGRELLESDRSGTSPVAVINRAMAERLWPNGRAVGRRFFLGAGTASERDFEVVGVVENSKYRRLVEETPNFYYVPWQQSYNPQMTLQVRGDQEKAALAERLRERIMALEPDLPVAAAIPLERRLDLFFLPQRLGAFTSLALGFLGLVLGVVGVYGVTALVASRRTREMGLRMALGARPGDVLKLALGSGLLAPTLGMVVGLAVALALSRFLAAFLATVSPVDPVAFGGVAMLLPAVAAAAAWIPARRASRLDPARTLRGE